MAFKFRWTEWNDEHIGTHGVSRWEAESVVESPDRSYPRHIGDDRFIARGQADSGRYLQVIYVFDPEDAVFVIHARPLTDREKKQLRRSRRR